MVGYYVEIKERELELVRIINPDSVPGHVAIIMDGNGRWAVEKGLPRYEGHRQGVETVRGTVRNSSALGIKILTLFAFSTENWQRPVLEVNYLMSLPEIYFQSELPELMRNNVQIRLIGDRTRLPRKVQKVVYDGVEATRNNSGMILNIALNYGSRSEIIMAVNRFIDEKAAGIFKGAVDEKMFSGYLYTAGIADPDLLIRTSGEKRISNFLLWQLAYSELLFMDVLWPDFSKIHLLEAVYDFQQRKRSYGKV
ncbi:MAG: isoprenyl transferase [Clostridia bacterium]|nr:isoprenyl transferase [Clostridia bacterium]